MANVWGAKYHEAEEGKKIWRLVVPKNFQMDYTKFEQFIARQSGQDSSFRIRKKSLWTSFIQHQEELLMERKTKFTLAENTGLLDMVQFGDRNTERYVYNANTILNSTGKKLDVVDVVFHPTLSSSVNAPMLLKPISVKVGGRDVFADVVRVSTPGEEFLPLSAGTGWRVFFIIWETCEVHPGWTATCGNSYFSK